jgi:mycofactocin precursor
MADEARKAEAVMTEQALMEPTTTAIEPDDRDLVAGDEALVAEALVAGEEALVAEELLVEEVSIDGMCGVY